MWNENQMTQKLNIEYPIIQAGMAGGTTTPELVAAVSNAGALGTLGAGYMTVEEMRESIQKINKLTGKPFAVNLFIPEDPELKEKEINRANELLTPFREELNLKEPQISKPSAEVFQQQIDVIIQEQVPVCSFTFGLPAENTVQFLQQNGVVVIGTATTVREAVMNEQRGMDMVVMQGSEAGGHRGTFSCSFEQALIGTMSLVPQAADHVDIPVIAAGGIMDGRGVLAALALGAQAVQMGTAFVTALESGSHPLHIDAILNSTEDETVVTSVFSGKPARGIQNEFIAELTPYVRELPGYPALNSLTKSIRREAAKQNRPEWIHLWSGQSPRLSLRQPAEKVITNIVSQVEEKLKAW